MILIINKGEYDNKIKFLFIINLCQLIQKFDKKKRF